MKSALIVAEMLCLISICRAQSNRSQVRLEAEYYVTAYAQHDRVPIALARAIVIRESNWQPCLISAKGAVGLMQATKETFVLALAAGGTVMLATYGFACHWMRVTELDELIGPFVRRFRRRPQGQPG